MLQYNDLSLVTAALQLPDITHDKTQESRETYVSGQ